MPFRRTLLAAALLGAASAYAQISLTPPPPSPSPLTDPTYSTDTKILFDLEAKFAADTATGGGAAFARWFAEDAVTLNDGQAARVGRAAIAAETNWKPEDYQLTWKPDAARMSPAGDMGFTWGSYQGRFKDHQGNWQTLSGRYMTVWKKQADGQWKVALDASNNAPPEAGACCSIH